MAQAQMVAQWVTYLSQKSSLSSSPLKKDPNPVICHSDVLKETLVTAPEKSPFQDGKSR